MAISLFRNCGGLFATVAAWAGAVTGLCAFGCAFGQSERMVTPGHEAPSSALKADEGQLVKIELVPEGAGWKPGEKVFLAVHYKIAPGWHLYWNGQNDSGMAPTLDIQGPEGYIIGAGQWPAPLRHVAGGDITDHIYEGELAILLPVTVPADAKEGSKAAFKVRSKWLVCKDVCLPGKGEAGVEVGVIGSGAGLGAGLGASIFAKARERLPKAFVAENPFVEVSIEAGALRVKSKAGAGVKGLAFFPGAESCAAANIAGDGASTSTPPSLNVALKVDGEHPVARAVGIIEVRTKAATVWYWIDREGTGGADAHRTKVETKSEGNDHGVK